MSIELHQRFNQLENLLQRAQKDQHDLLQKISDQLASIQETLQTKQPPNSHRCRDCPKERRIKIKKPNKKK